MILPSTTFSPALRRMIEEAHAYYQRRWELDEQQAEARRAGHWKLHKELGDQIYDIAAHSFPAACEAVAARIAERGRWRLHFPQTFFTFHASGDAGWFDLGHSTGRDDGNWYVFREMLKREGFSDIADALDMALKNAIYDNDGQRVGTHRRED